jgi:hypothetical protein
MNMTEEIVIPEVQPEIQPEPQKVMDPAEIYHRNIVTMSPRQMSGHLRRKARQKGSLIDGAFAIILSTIFNNTKIAGVGGKLESYLR